MHPFWGQRKGREGRVEEGEGEWGWDGGGVEERKEGWEGKNE